MDWVGGFATVPIDGDVPYEPVANLTSKKIPKKLSRKLLKVLS